MLKESMINKIILNWFENKNVLITGGTGLIGRQITDILCENGAHVRSVSLDEDIIIHPAAENVYCDVSDFSSAKEICKDIEVVFHLAGIQGTISSSETHLASHCIPTLMMNTNFLEAARQSGIKKLLYTSSIGAYAPADLFIEESPGSYNDSPMDFAGWAKRMAELQIYAYVKQYKLDGYSIVRPCNVYGPGANFDPENAMVIGTLMGRIARGDKPVKIWGDGSAVRDFAYSRDIAEGCILALYHGTGGKYINLASGKGYSILELVKTLASFIDFEYEFDTSKPSGYPKRVMDISLARDLLNFNPVTSLREGLENTWIWFNNNKSEFKTKKNYFE
jgi:GDP-L-fucose synthase